MTTTSLGLLEEDFKKILIQDEFFALDDLVKWLHKQTEVDSFLMETKSTVYVFKKYENGILLYTAPLSVRSFNEVRMLPYSYYLPEKNHYLAFDKVKTDGSVKVTDLIKNANNVNYEADQLEIFKTGSLF